MVVLSVVISIPIAWFHRIAEAGNCRLMFENEPDFTIKSKNMSGVLQEISSILTVDVTKIEDVPLIELSTCPKHPVDGHIYYNFFIITWSIGRRLKIRNQAEFKNRYFIYNFQSGLLFANDCYKCYVRTGRQKSYIFKRCEKEKF